MGLRSGKRSHYWQLPALKGLSQVGYPITCVFPHYSSCSNRSGIRSYVRFATTFLGRAKPYPATVSTLLAWSKTFRCAGSPTIVFFLHLHPITAGVQKPSPITSVTRGLAPCWPEWATRPLTPKYSSAQRYMKRNSSHHRTLRGPLLHHLPFGSGGDREEGHLGAAC